jgi:hypothetical protein
MEGRRMTEHNNIAAALASAQSEMGKALKDSQNPHFKSKYADLASVCAACMPALNANGIAVIQPIIEGEAGRSVVTRFIHASGETLECGIPLILGKNDMQGLGSAMTYARRYGLMALAGIAPEDDDGNAAVASAPKGGAQAQSISSDYLELRALTEKAGVPEETVCKAAGVEMLEMLPAPQFEAVKKRLNLTIQNKEQSND